MRCFLKSGQTAFVPDSRTRKKKHHPRSLTIRALLSLCWAFGIIIILPNYTDWQLMSWSKMETEDPSTPLRKFSSGLFPSPPLERETGRGEPDGRFVCLVDNGRLLWKFLGIFNIGYIFWRRKERQLFFYRKRPKTHWMVRTASVYLRFLAKNWLFLNSFF